MKAKISAFVICVEAIIYLLLYNLHDLPLIDAFLNDFREGNNFMPSLK